MSQAELQIQFSTSTAFASMIIRRLTHSWFSHVDIVLPGEGLMGVSGPGKYRTASGAWYKDPGGVWIRPFDPWPYQNPAKIARLILPEIRIRNVIEAGRSQIGKPFDDKALYSFLRDRAGIPSNKQVHDWRNTESWFCSEWVAWSCEAGGMFNYPLAITKEAVSPNDVLLLINPFMLASSIADFVNEVT